jgi:hypothetical protein
MDPWIGIDHLRFGIIGMPVSLVLMVVVSLMTPEPDAETQAMVDEIRGIFTLIIKQYRLKAGALAPAFFICDAVSTAIAALEIRARRSRTFCTARAIGLRGPRISALLSLHLRRHKCP